MGGDLEVHQQEIPLNQLQDRRGAIVGSLLRAGIGATVDLLIKSPLASRIPGRLFAARRRRERARSGASAVRYERSRIHQEGFRTFHRPGNRLPVNAGAEPSPRRPV
jgi:hypothetical protein